MAEAWVHLNGRLVPAAGAAVSVRDSGLLHGASTFTTMLAHQGVVFRLDRHVSRLLETTALMGIRTGATAESLSAATKEASVVMLHRYAAVPCWHWASWSRGTPTSGPPTPPP